jgi:hypothetical protein
LNAIGHQHLDIPVERRKIDRLPPVHGAAVRSSILHISIEIIVVEPSGGRDGRQSKPKPLAIKPALH